MTTEETALVAVLSILGSVAIAYFVYRCVRRSGIPAININTTHVPASTALYAVVPDSQIRDATVERFLKEIAGEKPIRFTPQQLSGFTNSYSARLGAGGYGAGYKGMHAAQRPHGRREAPPPEPRRQDLAGAVHGGGGHHREDAPHQPRQALRLLLRRRRRRARARVRVHGARRARHLPLRPQPPRRRPPGDARHRRRRRQGTPVPPRGVPAQDRALRHQARQRPPRRRPHAQGGRLRPRACSCSTGPTRTRPSPGCAARPGTPRRRCGCRPAAPPRNATSTASASSCSRSWAGGGTSTRPRRRAGSGSRSWRGPSTRAASWWMSWRAAAARASKTRRRRSGACSSSRRRGRRWAWW